MSGAARMGKSTLLQSVSGLDDNQIPTGHGIPVTAVRSRIFHSPTVRRAELEMHSPESFLAAVISPLHAALDLSPHRVRSPNSATGSTRKSSPTPGTGCC